MKTPLRRIREWRVFIARHSLLKIFKIFKIYSEIDDLSALLSQGSENFSMSCEVEKSVL